MGSQEFCRYCGVDTRLAHLDSCPAPELDELRDRIEVLEQELPSVRRDPPLNLVVGAD